jgi:hypothetical protein
MNDCLGCGVTAGVTALYCGKCLRAIKAHRISAENRDHIEAEHRAQMAAAAEWPVEQRGDPPGEWYERLAQCDLKLMEPEERDATLKKWRGHEWLAQKKRSEREYMMRRNEG